MQFYRNIAEIHIYVPVPVIARLHVEHPERMHYFMNNGSNAVAAFPQRQILDSANHSHRTVTPVPCDELGFTNTRIV